VVNTPPPPLEGHNAALLAALEELTTWPHLIEVLRASALEPAAWAATEDAKAEAFLEMARAHEEAERKAEVWVVALHHWIIFCFISIYFARGQTVDLCSHRPKIIKINRI
jgi:hypothetical protein